MMTPILQDARFDRKPSVIATDLKDELVLLDPETREMFRLNLTGRSVWQELERHDVDGLVGLLVASFSITPAEALADVQQLLADLLAAGLIVPALRRV